MLITPKAFANFSPVTPKAFADFSPVTPKAFANFSPGLSAAKTLGLLFSNFASTLKGLAAHVPNPAKELDAALRSYPKSFLDTVSTGSDSDLVNDTSQNHYEYCILITNQVATAPCTDCVQAQRLT
jgi:hypothetical protein